MMWIGILVISPLWGIASTALFMQIWLALANAAMNFYGLASGKVARSTTGLGLAVSLAAAIVFSLLLQGGYWLTSDFMHFGTTTAEAVVYWIFASATLIGILLEAPGKLRKTWRNATEVGTFEADIQARLETASQKV